MTTNTTGSTTGNTPSNTTRWAGRILAFLGAAHLLINGLLIRDRMPEWLDGALVALPADRLHALPPALGAFWAVPGSFGLPLLLLGLLVARLARTGIPVPAYVGWGLAAWAVVTGLILLPSPFPLALIPAAMLIAAARRADPMR
ncbi:DUF6463 family protein [Streptomyces sp.]|uniref:DUF6463 family protein n=1 Tax=Streptomyces sp. TaxID=1931 RepID=UPI002F929729